MKNREDQDERVGVRTLALIALLIIVLCGLTIWAPWTDFVEAISRGATAATSR